MNFIQEAFLQKVINCPEEILVMSRKNCHISGLDSIVVDVKPDGRLVRAFFAQKNHTMWQNNDNTQKPALGYHDHKYDLILSYLYGEAFNINVCTTQQGTMNRFKYKSMLSTGNPSLELVMDHEQCVSTETNLITRNFLEHPTLHTVYVPVGKKAAWIVEEGITVKEETTLITNLDESEISSKGLYESFTSKKEIVSMVSDFFKGEEYERT